MKKQKYRIAAAAGAVISALLIASASLPACVFAEENIPVTVDVNITYIVEGNVNTAGGDSFTLTADDPQAPMPEGSAGGKKTITIRDEGSFSFGSIYYDRPEIWWYTITRETTKKKGVTKDDTTYRVKVIALNDGHGYVLAYRDDSDDKAEIIYTDRVAPATGDTNTLVYPAAVFAAAAAALLLTAIMRRRRNLSKKMFDRE